MRTLITPAEAIRYSPVGSDFPVSQLFGQIKAEEWLLFVEFIGEDFYDLLVADMVDYSGIDEWDGGPYAIGDNVMDAGIVYTSLTAANSEGIGDPLNALAWKEADKFTTACYNLLWVDGFLKEFLAFSVIIPCVGHVTYPTGQAGTVQRIDEGTGMRTASGSTYSTIIDALQRGKHMRLKLLLKYMSENAAGCDFSGAFCASAGISGATNPGRTRRTFYR